jgi:hypothetical protein
MFEPWERFDAMKAASLMNKHRKGLRREHAGVRKLLRHKSKDQKAADMSKRINTLRQKWRDALKEQMRVCEALNRDFFAINFAAYFNAFHAQSRLFVTCNEVAQTLQKLSPTSNRSQVGLRTPQLARLPPSPPRRTMEEQAITPTEVVLTRLTATPCRTTRPATALSASLAP